MAPLPPPGSDTVLNSAIMNSETIGLLLFKFLADLNLLGTMAIKTTKPWGLLYKNSLYYDEVPRKSHHFQSN